MRFQEKFSLLIIPSLMFDECFENPWNLLRFNTMLIVSVDYLPLLEPKGILCSLKLKNVPV